MRKLRGDMLTSRLSRSTMYPIQTRARSLSVLSSATAAGPSRPVLTSLALPCSAARSLRKQTPIMSSTYMRRSPTVALSSSKTMARVTTWKAKGVPVQPKSPHSTMMTRPPVRFMVNKGVFLGATDSSVNAARRSIFHRFRSSHLTVSSFALARSKKVTIIITSSVMSGWLMGSHSSLHFSFTSLPFITEPPSTLVCEGSMITLPASEPALGAHDATIL